MNGGFLASQENDAIESFWRSLRYFSIYRLSIATLFLFAALFLAMP
jgi:hypothetical protein